MTSIDNKKDRLVKMLFHLSVLLLFMLSYESNAVVHNKAITHILNDSGIGKQDLKETAFIKYINADGTQSLMYISSKRLYKIECDTLGKLGFLKAVGYPAEAYHLFEEVHHSQENDEYLKKIGLILDYDIDGKPKRGPVLTCNKSADTFLMIGNPSLRDASGKQNENIGVYIKYRDKGHDSIEKYLYRLECWDLVQALGYEYKELILMQESDVTRFVDTEHEIKCISGEIIKHDDIRVTAIENEIKIGGVIEKQFSNYVDIQFTINSKLESKVPGILSRFKAYIPNDDCAKTFTMKNGKLTGVIGSSFPSHLKECEFKVTFGTFETQYTTKTVKLKFGEKPKLIFYGSLSRADKKTNEVYVGHDDLQYRLKVRDTLGSNTEVVFKIKRIDGECDWLHISSDGSRRWVSSTTDQGDIGKFCNFKVLVYRSVDEADPDNHTSSELKMFEVVKED
jgi:hypothetical protein